MTENTKQDYRTLINQMGKKEFTIMKMQEYGFWPKDLPTPYEKQLNETPEQYSKRKALVEDYKSIIERISKLYKEKQEINDKLRDLRKKYDETWDIERIRKDIAQTIMKESIARRTEKKKQRELEKHAKSEAWKKKKAEQIIFIGKGYSSFLYDNETDQPKLELQGLPVIKSDIDLANFLEIDYKKLRFLSYHRDVVTVDHYHRYTIPKRKGGMRNIAAPKPILKSVQRKILEDILNKFSLSQQAHGFIKERSILSGALAHNIQPALVINMDIENFFPTISFERVRGMFKSAGYSGFISSLLAMLCTYCERVSIEVKNKTRFIATTKRILPQGSPASPMITNIICRRLDQRLNGLASKFGFTYTRYADDMSFSINDETNVKVGRFYGLVSKIVKDEGFEINKEKTRFLRKNNRQSITGVVVNNEKLGVNRMWMRRFRAAIHNASKLRSNGDLPIEVKRELSGMASWVRSVNPERYKKLIETAMEVIK
ncbi:MAG: RNA-directed DNA polymerase [Candidatus Lokiarchaeota archaeon]|nr:RNA-directed DNA polymerase [Candidatus Lokiarchaeota archaeon]